MVINEFTSSNWGCFSSFFVFRKAWHNYSNVPRKSFLYFEFHVCHKKQPDNRHRRSVSFLYPKSIRGAVYVKQELIGRWDLTFCAIDLCRETAQWSATYIAEKWVTSTTYEPNGPERTVTHINKQISRAGRAYLNLSCRRPNFLATTRWMILVGSSFDLRSSLYTDKRSPSLIWRWSTSCLWGCSSSMVPL